MASGIVSDSADPCQSKKHYTVTFSSADWRRFWQFIHLSAYLTEYLEELANSETPMDPASSVFLRQKIMFWHTLADRLARLLSEDIEIH